MNISVIGTGTWQFGGEWGKQFTAGEVANILAASKDKGINLIDTAECYGDHLSEELIGSYLKKGRRDWILATKFGHHYHGYQDRTWHFEPADVRKQLEASLKALGTDYVDIYQFHSGSDEQFETPGLWEELRNLVESGKVRYLGISVRDNKSLSQVSRALEIGADLIQIVYNRLDREPEAKVFPRCERDNLGVLARVPLASGLLSGKYPPGSRFGEGDVRNTRDVEWMEERLVRAQRIIAEEVPEGVSPAQWALAWCLKNPAVSSVIPGCRDTAQLLSNAAAADLV
jgi:aryl-alcohol dehydrogenase-like predicted oxidoreductase